MAPPIRIPIVLLLLLLSSSSLIHLIVLVKVASALVLLLLSAKGIPLLVSVKLAGHGAEVFTAVAAVIICLCFWSLWAPLWDLTVRLLLLLILGLFTLEWGGCRLAALLSPILLRCSSCSLRTIAILSCGFLG